MKKQLLRFTLHTIIIYLTGGALNLDVAASPPLGGNGTHFHGVIDGQQDKQQSDQFPNLHYARTSVANLNVGEPYTVRLVYFLPNDRAPVPDIDTKLDTLIKNVQKFYADEMERHGLGRKTFTFETDADGNARVHRLDGRFASSYYSGAAYNVLSEVTDLFDISKNINLVVVDGGWHGTDQAIWDSDSGGSAFVYIDRDRLDTPHYLTIDGGLGYVTAHELGHVFGLAHDFRDPAYIMAYRRGVSQRLSRCNAEWLDAHRFFNVSQTSFNRPTTIRMLLPLLSPPNAIRLRFEITDADGLHQAQLRIPTTITDPATGVKLRECKSLNGQSDTIEFITTALTLNRKTARLSVIDVYGNSASEYFPIDTSALLPAEFVVSIPDANLATAVQEALGLDPSDVITQLAMLDISRLRAQSRDIADLTGLAGLTNLIELNLGDNSISDISVLAGLTNLTSLDLGVNNISDISILAGLTNLISLSLRGNNISDISVLAGLTNLTSLSLGVNNISDISVLAGLTNLTSLGLGGNNISDISVLAGLTNLTWLDLGSNSISDISAISGLTSLTNLILENNNISDISVLAGLTNLTWLVLGSNSISDISAISGLTSLTSLILENNNVSDISAVSGLTNLTWLGLGSNSVSEVSAVARLTQLTRLNLSYNTISDVSPLLGLNLTGTLWDSTGLYLEGNPLSYVSINTHIPALQNRGVIVEFDNVSVEVVEPVNIPNPHLRAAIEKARGKASGDTITTVDMAILPRLDAPNADINDLTGLEHATNLTGLYLQHNSISDISAVAGLTNLTDLKLRYNAITDISAVARLTNLTDLTLDHNSISDISPVAGLTNLTWLGLSNNAITDISAVAGLTNLRRLALVENNITDISAVAKLTNLTELWLWDNSISDLSPLVANTGLGSGDTVYVQSNPLSYLSIHTHIPILQSRGVTVEFDNRPHPALLKISGDNQKGASFASLSQPLIVEAQDANGSALAGISVTFTVSAGGGTLSTQSTLTDENGRAQTTLILGPNLGTNTVEVSAAGIESKATFYAIADSELPPTIADINSDGHVNVLDLIVIASSLGQSGYNSADVNGDRVVTVLDLVLAAGLFDGAAAAPSAQPQVPETLTAVEVQGWLNDARTLEVKDAVMKKGMVVLEQLLVSLTPTETELLANYPNPFNPETWIPYRLAADAFVTLTIYDGNGHVVRSLEIGHRIAAAYENRSKAIYWDGRNGLGEQVASGIYFYHLSAGDFSATRRMVILK